MKLNIKDGLWLIAIVCVCLAWRNDSQTIRVELQEMRRESDQLHQLMKRNDQATANAIAEADLLAEEVRRMRGVVKSSLQDQRTWFELAVERNQIVAIRPAVSNEEMLTLKAVELIEAETGLKASRLRHFLSPISALKLD